MSRSHWYIKEDVTTSSASAGMEDLVEGMGNLFSQQEEVMANQRGIVNGLRSGRSYKVNYDKPSTPISFTPPSTSPSLVIPTR